MAIDGDGLVREMLTDILSQPSDEHLAEWLRIVGPDNRGRKIIHRYARIFELQHYCRVIAERHSKSIVRNKEHLRNAFASFFGMEGDAIRNDFRFVKGRLRREGNRGPAWLDAI